MKKYSGQDTLPGLREEIDSVDQQLLALFSQRQRLVEKVGAVKRRESLPPLQPARWQEVLHSRQESAKELHLRSEFVHDIWSRIHEEALRIEEEMRIRK